MGLSEDSKLLRDKCITLDEIGNALLQMKNGKSPGSDGFTTDFYNFFWPNIKHFVHRSYKESFFKGNLSDFQAQGIITCIPKEGKDRNYIKKLETDNITKYGL